MIRRSGLLLSLLVLFYLPSSLLAQEAVDTHYGSKEAMELDAACREGLGNSGTRGAYPHPSPDGVMHLLVPAPPFFSNYDDPHLSYEGHEVTLKAVIWPVESVDYHYTWEVVNPPQLIAEGDLTAGNFDQYSALEAKFTFPTSSTFYVARLTVTGSDGDEAEAFYRVWMGPKNDYPTVRRHIAIEDGLWYLHKLMFNRTDINYGDPVPVGSFSGNVGLHSQCIESFTLSGFGSSDYPGIDPDVDPYAETVDRALNHLLSLFSSGYYNIMSEPASDTNLNGYGLAASKTSDCMYENGMALTALASVDTPDAVVPVVRDPNSTNPDHVNGRAHKEIIQDFCDFIYYAQNGNGGWRYTPNYGGSDWSVTQWPALAVFIAQYKAKTHSTSWNVDVAPFVLTAMQNWITSTQNTSTGEFGYTGSGGGNIALTGSGIIAMDWLLFNGIDMEQRIQNACQWMGNKWLTTTNHTNAYNMYAAMKGATMHGAGDENIPEIDAYGGHIWHYDPVNPDVGYWKWLCDKQLASGSWDLYSYQPSAPAWAICILAGFPGGIPPGAVLIVTDNPTDVDTVVTFDGTQSQDLHNPPLDLIRYTFDFGDGTPPYTEEVGNAPDGAFDGITTHVYTQWTGAHPDYKPGYLASLVVTNADEKNSFPTYVEVVVRPPNHPPTIVMTWTPEYPFVGQTVTFDASGSYDIDEPNGDAIEEYAWDFDNDGLFDEIVGTDSVVEWKFMTPGPHPVGLRLTDRTNLWYNSPWPVEKYFLIEVKPLPMGAMVYVSPQSSFCYGMPPSMIYVRNQDIASVNVITDDVEKIFNGTPFLCQSIDALDLMVEEESRNAVMAFSVDKNHMLCDMVNTYFYMRKEDVAVLNTGTGTFERILAGVKIGCPGVDAVSILDDGRLVISPTEDFLCYSLTDQAFYVHEEDLAAIDLASGDIYIYVSGKDIGVTTLDAADIMDGKVYFSVKEPIFIYNPPHTQVYLEDCDVAVYDPATGAVELYLKGSKYFICDMDAVSLGTVIGPMGFFKPPMKPNPKEPDMK